MTGALASLLSDAVSRPDAVIAGGADATLPGTVLLDLAGTVSAALRAGDILPDEPVLLTSGNRASDLAGLLGIWLAGGVAVPCHETTPSAARDRLRDRTGARFMIDGSDLSTLAADLPPRRELLAGAAMILFTSGTTGVPKGVVLGHERFRDKLLALQRLLAIRPGDSVVVPLQLTFIYGLWVSLLALHAGARLVLAPRFRVETVGRVLVRGATVLAAVPTMLRALAIAPPPASALRMILSGGEPLGMVASAADDCWPGASLVDLYGLTETGACDFCARTEDRVVASSSIGRPTEGVAFRIERGDEGVGELGIKSPFGMLGYLDDPSYTAAAFDHGFFRTGDLARPRDGGRVEIVGRIKEIVSRGGVKIAPLELEALFERHPAVAAALCTGVRDPRRGESVHVMLVAKPGQNLDPERLQGWAAERIERYKLPDRIHVGEALPQGPTGKADRAALRRLLQGLC
jgi:long-chain acyl-CoA synthetase